MAIVIIYIEYHIQGLLINPLAIKTADFYDIFIFCYLNKLVYYIQ